jgi:tRNA/tmRNA/rRNA uracil-C5-methylase (TrmA/RlmC/RlmD family)
MITMCMIALPVSTEMMVRGTQRALLVGGQRPTVHHGEVTDQMAVPVAVGDAVDLLVGEVVHGGWCVARVAAPAADDAGPAHAASFVVLVRHALPGEQVRAVITQVASRLARADAVEILQPAAERVRPPCPYARPGGCGGCDWQHASLTAQRAFKARVISQQLRRIAGIDREVVVEPLPGDDSGLGWRTRLRFAVGKDGRPGLHRHRSAEVVAIGDCLIAHPSVTEAEVTRQSWPGAKAVDVAVAPHSGQRAVMVHGGQMPSSGPRILTHRAAGRDWQVSAAGFWQVHPQAADTLAAAVLAGLSPQPGETALDLFCGAGLFAGVLATAVGSSGRVIAVERDGEAAADARHNLRSTPWAKVRRGDAAEVISRIGLSGATIAVLDPPRAGVDRELIDVLCAGQALRKIAYVSCDPATLARDLAALARHGWRLADLRGFDAFPMTHHVECLAIVEPPPG